MNQSQPRRRQQPAKPKAAKKQATSKTPPPTVNVTIEQKPDKALIPVPHPSVPRPMAHTLRDDGLERKKADTRALMMESLLTSSYDRFLMAVLHNLFEPSRPYPLPGIRRSGLPGPNMSEAYMDGCATSATDGPVNVAEQRGTTVHFTNINEESCLIGRYSRFSGRVNTQFSFTTNSSGEAEYWFVYDPTVLDFPLLVLDMTTLTVANYTSLIIKDYVGWTSNPFPIARTLVSEIGSHPVEEFDRDNLYYVGAAAMEVSTLNANAWLSTSYQVRTGDNIVDRIYNHTNFYGGSSYADNCGWNDLPVTGLGALSMYTGETWHYGSLKKAGLIDPDDEKFWASHCLNRCWAMGAPFVRCVVRTQSNGAPAAGTVAFNVSLNVWAGTAPLKLEQAGGMPLETAPFPSPTWLRALKTRGSVSADAKMVKAYQEAARTVASSLPSLVTGTSNVERALASQPKETLTHAAKMRPMEANSSSGWFGLADKVINYIPTVLAGINTAAALGSAILSFL